MQLFLWLGMSFDSNPGELYQHFQLKDEDVRQPISDVHIQDICLTQSIQWQFLPAILKMEYPTTVVDDIKKGGKPENEMRMAFFSKWQKQKGRAAANYDSLIRALLRIGSRDHAEHVCQLVKSAPLCLTPRGSGKPLLVTSFPSILTIVAYPIMVVVLLWLLDLGALSAFAFSLTLTESGSLSLSYDEVEEIRKQPKVCFLDLQKVARVPADYL